MGDSIEKRVRHIEPRRVTFGSPLARIEMEVRQQIKFLDANLVPLPIPQDGYNLTPISFDQEHLIEGGIALAILEGSPEHGRYGKGKEKLVVSFVEPRTIQILDALGLPYINHAAVETATE